MMGFLQYMKKNTIKQMLRIPGMRKYKLIEKILAKRIILTIGPSRASVSTKAKAPSITPRSFEKTLLSLPVEVVSK